MKIERVLFAGRGRVEVGEATLDTRLQPRQMLVRTACSMVSQGTELAALTGTHTRSADPKPPAWLLFPSVPGYLMCGEVVEKGEEVTEFRVGERVIAEGAGCWNSHVSHLVTTASEWVTKIPDGVTYEEAVPAKLASVAMYGLRVLHAEFGERVAIFGLGVVGQFAARMCALAGFREVVAVDPLANRRQAAGGVRGVTVVTPDDPLVSGEMVAKSREQGYDCVIEASGHPSGFLQALAVARVHARIAIPSAPHQPVQIRLYDQVMHKSLQILGAHGSSQPAKPTVCDRWNEPLQKDLYLRLVAEKRIDVQPIFSHKVSFRQAPEIYRGLLERSGEYLGVVFDWRERTAQRA